MQINTPVYLIKAPKEGPKSTIFLSYRAYAWWMAWSSIKCSILSTWKSAHVHPASDCHMYSDLRGTTENKWLYVCVRALFSVWTYFKKNRPRNRNEGPRIRAKWAKNLKIEGGNRTQLEIKSNHQNTIRFENRFRLRFVFAFLPEFRVQYQLMLYIFRMRFRLLVDFIHYSFFFILCFSWLT